MLLHNSQNWILFPFTLYLLLALSSVEMVIQPLGQSGSGMSSLSARKFVPRLIGSVRPRRNPLVRLNCEPVYKSDGSFLYTPYNRPNYCVDIVEEDEKKGDEANAYHVVPTDQFSHAEPQRMASIDSPYSVERSFLSDYHTSTYLSMLDGVGNVQLTASKSLSSSPDSSLLSLKLHSDNTFADLYAHENSPYQFHVDFKDQASPSMFIRLGSGDSSSLTVSSSMDFIVDGVGYQWKTSPRRLGYELFGIVSQKPVKIADYSLSPEMFDRQRQASVALVQTTPDLQIAEDILLVSLAVFDFLYMQYCFVPPSLELQEDGSAPGAFKFVLTSGFPMYSVTNVEEAQFVMSGYPSKPVVSVIHSDSMTIATSNNRNIAVFYHSHYQTPYQVYQYDKNHWVVRLDSGKSPNDFFLWSYDCEKGIAQCTHSLTHTVIAIVDNNRIAFLLDSCLLSRKYADILSASVFLFAKELTMGQSMCSASSISEDEMFV